MKAYSVPTLFMAAICLTIAMNEVLTRTRHGFKRIDMAFALTCLGGFFYNLLCTGEYSIDSPLQSIPYLSGLIITLELTGLALFWYVAEGTGLIPRPVFIGYAIWTFLGVMAQLLNPGGIMWAVGQQSVRHIRLPFGLTAVYNEIAEGWPQAIVNCTGGATLLYLIFILVKSRRAGQPGEMRGLLAVVGILTIAYLNDAAVVANIYSFIYLTEYGWLALILMVAERRNHEREASASTRRKLRKTEASYRELFDSARLGIFQVRPNGGFIDVNPEYARMFGYASPEEFLAEVHDIAAVFADPGRIGEIIAQMEAQPGLAIFESSYRRRDGSTFLGRSRVKVLVDPSEASRIVQGIVEDITESRQAEEKIRRSLQEKETLLRELYHRTKNNMSVIIAMMNLQAGLAEDERLSRAFSDAEDRIHSMALVHEKLYEARDLSHVDLKEFIMSLLPLLMHSYGMAPGRISIETELDPVSVLIDTAIPCGMLLTELITNAFKHAFPSGRDGNIFVGLRREPDGLIRLEVSDDGVGVASGFDMEREGRIGGMTIYSLAQNQLGGKVSVAAGRGLAWTIEFRDDQYQARV